MFQIIQWQFANYIPMFDEIKYEKRDAYDCV